MNTFGASAYLKAERDAVKETLVTLKERLKKLKIEELSIRSEIRISMGAATTGARGDQKPVGEQSVTRSDLVFESGEDSTPRGTRVWVQDFDSQRHQHEQNELSVNQAPLELDINEALKIISRYKAGSGDAGAYEGHDPFFDRGSDDVADEVEVVEEEEEEEEEEKEEEEEVEGDGAEDNGNAGNEEREMYIDNEDDRDQKAEGEIQRHFFEDFSLEREDIDEDGERFADRPGTSSQMCPVEAEGRKPAKIIKLDDNFT